MTLTDGRTFIGRQLSCSVTVGNTTAIEVIRREFDVDLVARQDADVVLAHLPGDRRENVVATIELDSKHRARKGLGNLALDFDLLFLASQPLLV